ncbi:MAG: leucyl aminopeptidase [Deltaproteobacteria bacterium]|jgi:leucyl aminopeptidase|nr:leucyl aminopeptidase [Deltaproteobacteria bacterium]
MQINIQAAAQSWQADCVIVPVLAGTPFLQNIPALAAQLPWLAEAAALDDFKAKKGESCLVYGPAQRDAQKQARQDSENIPPAPILRVLFCGLGKSGEFKPMFLRDAVASGVKSCAGLKLEQLALPLEDLEALREQLKMELSTLVEESVLGAKLAVYSCDLYRGKPKAEQSEENNQFKPTKLDLLCPEAGLPESALAAIRKAGALAHGICQARDLINGPANIVTPTRLEEKAQELARTYGFNCTSLGPDYLRDSGFGAFWGVARGSAEEPRLIILEYKPQNLPAAESDESPIVIVGKGVTFDSGGLSLKPPAKMHEMKSDMAGAGAVLGLFAALGEALLLKDEALLLKDEVVKDGNSLSLTAKHVIGIIPCSDNMPDGNAYRPGDILTTLSGKTVEIISTDAEGRLLLCDCLTLAQQRWKPAALVDVATLTGACVVALGENTTGLFGNDEALRDRLLELGGRTSERIWPLPIYDEDIEGLKSDVADLRNTGPREGGALFAALFLKQFIEPGTVWAHLDIAGPAYSGKKTPTSPGGASGVALRTLFELVTE